ncbi:MAG: hypothetical protein IAE92_05655 [Burkholderiaceae bacterium]|nr:hypothetical protein [Burkholderiaceae bacterium]
MLAHRMAALDESRAHQRFRQNAMISILCFMLLGSIVPIFSATAQDAVIMEREMNECVSSGAYTSPENAKELLLEIVKRQAASAFYGELIRSTTIVQDSVLTSDEIRSAVQGLVRIDANPEFYNGAGLGEICIRARAFVTAADMRLFEPVEITGKRECDTSDRPRLVRVEEVTDRVRSEALILFDGRLARIALAQRLELLHEVKYVEAETGFDRDSGTYCANFTGFLIPFEVYALLGEPPPPLPLIASPTPTVTPLKPLLIVSVSPVGSIPVGTIVTLRGSGPATAQIEVIGNGAMLGTTFTNERGAWNFAAPFNVPGYYRLTTRMYLTDGTVRPGSGDVTIRVVAPTRTPTTTNPPTPTPTATETPTSIPTITPLPPPIFTPRPPAPSPTPRSPTPAPVSYGAVTLLSPATETDIATSPVTLTWRPVANLSSGDHYVVVINHTNGTSWLVTDSTNIQFDLKAYAQYQFIDGFHWYVGVCGGAAPGDYNNNPCTPISGQSEQRTFKWAEAGEPPKGNGGTPPYPPPGVP